MPVLAGLVVCIDFHPHGFCFYIWKNLDISQPHWTSRTQFDSSGNAVPISLSMIGHAVRIGAHINDHAVIDSQGQAVNPWCKLAQVEYMGCGEAQAATNFLVVDPQPCFPMRSFQEKLHLLPAPVSRDLNLALVPGSSFIIALRLQPEWRFEIPLQAVRLIARFLKPGLVDNIPRPIRIYPDRLPITLGCKASREPNGLLQ